jgi:hypothetical protein
MARLGEVAFFCSGLNGTCKLWREARGEVVTE